MMPIAERAIAGPCAWRSPILPAIREKEPPDGGEHDGQRHNVDCGEPGVDRHGHSECPCAPGDRSMAQG